MAGRCDEVPSQRRIQIDNVIAPPDCNGNSISDHWDLWDCDGSAWCSDCNGNRIIDECDIASAWSEDCLPDGQPDECQFDTAYLNEGCESIWQMTRNDWVIINMSNPIGITDWLEGIALTVPFGDLWSYVAANYRNCGDGPGGRHNQ